MDTDRKGQSKRAVRIICHHDGTQAQQICTVNTVREPDAPVLDKMDSSMIVLMFIGHIKTLTKKREKYLLKSFLGSQTPSLPPLPWEFLSFWLKNLQTLCLWAEKLLVQCMYVFKIPSWNLLLFNMGEVFDDVLLFLEYTF